MSYSSTFPCSNCVKKGEKEGEGKCIDAIRIDEAIRKIHATPFDSHEHRGNGSIILFCYAHETK